MRTDKPIYLTYIQKNNHIKYGYINLIFLSFCKVKIRRGDGFSNQYLHKMKTLV